MERIWSTDLSSRVGERVQLAGWLQHLRRLRLVGFVVLRDGRGTAQVVVDDARLLARVAAVPAESVLRVEGVVHAVPQAPNGIEIRDPEIEVIALAADPPPVAMYRPSLPAQLPTILDHAAVTLRHPHQRAIFHIAATAAEAFRRSLRRQGFVEIQTPKIVGSATEGGANVFRVDYMGREAFLAQSPQLYKQIMVGVFERVFEVGPVFRAEPHDTPRHLNEYVSLDAEMGFIQDHTTVMDALSQVLRDVLQTIGQEDSGAIGLRGMALPTISSTIPSIDFEEAQQLISRATGENLAHEQDLAPSHERWLGDWAKRTFGSDFLFVVGYPMSKRPFYTHPDERRPDFSKSFDLLFRGLELSTGGQRLHLYSDYLAVLAARGMDPEQMSWYLEAFRHGMPPHGGFAIGLERLVAQLIGVPNIRATTLFPRDLHRLTP